MTDNEIVKALECCKDKMRKACFYCPLKNDKKCLETLAWFSLDLINRQKAENETLQHKIIFMMNIVEQLQNDNIRLIKESLERIDDIKSDTIKKFAERLKDRFRNPKTYTVQLDKLAKEMTEETKHE